MNDNERQGLPADIDLVSTSIANLLRKPGDLKRLENLRSCLIRLLAQVDKKIAESKNNWR
ncbi:VHS1124 protein [Vibrio phage 1]|nr:VHS1124 protein [Vibrio phage 1]